MTTDSHVLSEIPEHSSCELLSQLFLHWMSPASLFLELWVEFTSQFLQAKYPVYHVYKHFSSHLAQLQISTHGYTSLSVHFSAVGANYSSWSLWRGKIAWQIVPGSPRGGERDETYCEEISGNMGRLAEATDRCFYFCPSFVLLFFNCTVTFSRLVRWKNRRDALNC